MGALARASAKGSQLWDSIPPLGSAILTPLSETLLCEAVSITPITDPSIFSDLSAARIPILYTVDSSSAASALNPAVPYDNLTPVQKHTHIFIIIIFYFLFFVENREREIEKGKEEPLGGGKREEELRRRERWSSFMVDESAMVVVVDSLSDFNGYALVILRQRPFDEILCLRETQCSQYIILFSFFSFYILYINIF